MDAATVLLVKLIDWPYRFFYWILARPRTDDKVQLCNSSAIKYLLEGETLFSAFNHYYLQLSHINNKYFGENKEKKY